METGFFNAELGYDAGEISGVAVRYGTRSTASKGPYGKVYDRFEAGCFGDVDELDVTLNRAHDRTAVFARTSGGGLELQDTPEALMVKATPADTQLWRDTRTLLENRTLRAFSVEVKFDPNHVKYDYGTRTRSITQAWLTGLGIVDRPGMPGTDITIQKKFDFPEIKTYARIAATASGIIPYGKTLQCECLKSLGCRAVQFNKGALDEIGDSVLAVGGSYDAPVASVAQKGLRFKETDKGLEWEADIPDDENGRKILAASEVAPVVGRPFIDVEASDTVKDDDLLTYRKAIMRSLIIRSTDAIEGWDPAKITMNEEKRIQTWDLPVI